MYTRDAKLSFPNNSKILRSRSVLVVIIIKVHDWKECGESQIPLKAPPGVDTLPHAHNDHTCTSRAVTHTTGRLSPRH